MTLSQMYFFESCSIFRRTYGRLNPLFSHPEDAVRILWTPGEYGKVYFMLLSQLYPHYKELHIHDWSMTVFSTETTGAIRRPVENPPPVTGGQVPPHAPLGLDGNDPIHPDFYGPPGHDDINIHDGDIDDSGAQDAVEDDGMIDPPPDPPSGDQPHSFPPHPPSQPPVVTVTTASTAVGKY